MADTANTGIYEIVNAFSGKRYIGSAVNLKVRFLVHKKRLRENKHHSRYLQSAWNKYGEAAFEFRVIALCDRSDLIMLEQREFDEIKPEYNIARVAGSALGGKWSDEARERMRETVRQRPQNRPGWKHSPEALAKLSAAKLGNTATRGKRRKPESVAKTALAHTGMKRSAETRARMSVAMAGKKRPARSADHCAKISAFMKSRRLSPQSIAKMAATKRGAKLTPDHRAKIGEASKRAWAARKAAATNQDTENATSVFLYQPQKG